MSREALDALLAKAPLPVSVTVDKQDMVDAFDELTTDREFAAVMRIAPSLRDTLIALDISPANALCALGFAAGLIGKHDLEETPAETLLHMSVPIVFGNLNAKRT